MYRIALVLIGFVLGTYLPSTHAQTDFRNPDLQRLLMESSERQHQREIADQQQANLKDEFQDDQKEFTFNYETAILWQRLAQDQDAYYAAKWNKKEQNIGLHLEIHMLKQELQRRAKEADKYLKRK